MAETNSRALIDPKAGEAASPLSLVQGRLLAGFNSQNVASIVVVVLLLIIVTYPLFYVFKNGLWIEGQLSLVNLETILGNPTYRQALINTLIVGLGSSAVGMLLAGPMALLCARTNMPGRGLLQTAVIFGFVAPGFVCGIAWSILAGPNAGYLNQLFNWLTGSDQGFVSIYTLPGLVFVTMTTVYPIGFLFFYNAFQAVDAEVEEAASISGANQLRVLLDVTLPLGRPAAVAAGIIMFLQATILYGVAEVIGVPSGIYVVTTQIAALFNFPPQVGLASALSMPLLAVTIVLLYIQRRIIGGRSYSTISGRGGRYKLLDLGAWRWVATAGTVFIVFATVIMPYGVVVLVAFLKQYYNGPQWSNFSLVNFHFIFFDYDQGVRSIINSLTAGIVAATAATALGAVSAYLTNRRVGLFQRGISGLAMAPMAVPAMIFAIGIFVAYSQPPLKIAGTLWILIVAYLTAFIPMAYMSSFSGLAGVDPMLEAAAGVSGASPARTVWSVTLPLMRLPLFASWLLVFIPSVKEQSASVLLYNARTSVMGTAILDANAIPNLGAVGALSVVLIVVTVVVVGIGYRIVGGNVLAPGGR